MPPPTLLLAAGKSTRIRSIAGDTPKPLLPVAGRAVIDWNLAWLASEGIRDVWINLHHQPDAIRTHVGDGARYGLTVHYSLEPEILGTAGAVRKLERELSGGDFLVLYGDNVTRTSLASLLAAHAARHAIATIGVFDFRGSMHSGIAGGRLVTDETNLVREFHEGTGSTSPWVNAGVYALSPRVFDSIAPAGVFADFAREVFPEILASGGTVLAHPIDGFCFGIDTPQALAVARAKLEALA